ncbi:S-methyl-5-thioribose kinase [Vagococcus vulneris]|nr:S-methyl-5-thioribose kinase [Vagococcus vulneris]
MSEKFSIDSLESYVKANTDLFAPDALLLVEEIGDGNINYVFSVTEVKTDISCIVKYSDQYLRSSGRPLSIDRNRIEVKALQIEHTFVPNAVPEIYYYNEEDAVIIMENISAYKNLRHQLAKRLIFPTLAEKISDFLAETLLNTTDHACVSKLKKERLKEFINIDMCDISEDLVFTEPYNDYKQRNVITSGNEEFVLKNIYQNTELINEVAQLRDQYMNNSQSLLHGDLHSGSIFINEQGLKVIDPEFAFYGPAGYDIGNVLAHLIFPYIQNQYYQTDRKFEKWLVITISDVFDLVYQKLNQLYQEKVKLSLYQSTIYRQKYLADVMSDALGYTGTEIIRRVIGDSKVAELTTVPDSIDKLAMERKLLVIATQLIVQRKSFVSGQDVITCLNTQKEGR